MKPLHRVLIVATTLSLVLPCLVPTAFAQPGRKIYIIGCDRGKVSLNQAFDPFQSIGKRGSKIANWHIALAQKARYAMSFASPQPFQMKAYRKNSRTGKWDFLRVSGPGKRQGRLYVWGMTVSRSGSNTEEYLMQAIPAPQAQGLRHVFTASVNPSGCKKTPPAKPYNPCPPGYYDDGHGTFGQPHCVKKR